MLTKIYVDQYRCLQNFEIDFSQLNSALILGRNGSGKTSFFEAIEVLQRIGQGTTQIKSLISRDDFAFTEISKPIVFEVQATIKENKYHYLLEIELPENFREPKVKREELSVDRQKILQRDGAKTTIHKAASFTLDWHHIGLPLVSVRNDDEPIAIFRTWLRNIIILSPYPRKFSSTSKLETAFLDREGKYILDWVRNLLAESPSSYNDISSFLKQRMIDFDLFKFETTGKDEKELIFIFHAEHEQGLSIRLNFSQLSDGEKIYFLTAALIATINNNNSTLCLWDEPDNFISLIELSHFISECRKKFENSGNNSQLMLTTHNADVINEFSSHNTFIFARFSHLQPTRSVLLQDKMYVSPSVIEAFENGELD